MKLLISIAIIFTFLMPTPAIAALEQPPGQFPITEPLQPLEPGVQPNYSGNIQDGEPANLDPEDSDTSSTPESQDVADGEDEIVDSSGEAVSAQETEETGSLFWVLVVILLVVLAVVGLWVWRKKSMTGAAVVALVLVIPWLFANAPISSAQSLPKNSPPIQRVIEEEGVQTFSQPVSQPAKRSSSPLYGLMAAGLLMIAAGAVYVLWIRSESKSQE